MSDQGKPSTTQPPTFLSRWSQRKLHREEADEAQWVTPHQERTESSCSVATTDAGQRETLPDIDSLDERSDYSAFISPKVSDELQRQALRKLFSSARFNVRDGLDDYDEDYRSFESLGDTITAEMRHQMERVQQEQVAASDNCDEQRKAMITAEKEKADDPGTSSNRQDTHETNEPDSA